MPSYPDPNGGSMQVANRAEAVARGWTPSMGTFGVNSDSNSGGGGGGGGGGGSAPAAARNPDLAGYVAAMQASSGLSIKQLDETKREFDATLAQQQNMWRLQGLPELAIKQRTADLEEAKFRELTQQAQFSQQLQTRQQDLAQQVQLGQLTNAQAQQQLAREIQTGQLVVSQGQLANARDQQQLAREIQTGQLGVSQGQLGLDTLKTAASLSGPENWIQAANFSRGVANSQLPGFVNQLLTGQRTATMGGPAPGAVPSAPLTMQGMAAQMGALDPSHMAQFYANAVQAAGTGGPTPVPAQTTSAADAGAGVQPTYATPNAVAGAFGRPTAQQDQTTAAANAMGKLFQQGGQALGPQQLEGLTPTETKMLQGGGAALGYDVNGFNSAYAGSRIGQKAALPSYVGTNS